MYYIEHSKLFQTVDVIGNLAANSSIIIPVKITLKSGNTRHGSCSILLIVYDYDCGGTRSNSASVILTGSCGGGNTGCKSSFEYFSHFENIYFIW